MSMVSESLLVLQLERLEQAEWDRLVQDLLPQVHPVDRAALRIWFSFWPLKLVRLLKEADNLVEVVRERRLEGKFKLEDQVDDSVGFFFGAYFWPGVKKAVASQAEGEISTDRFDLQKAVRGAAEQAASQAGVDAALLLAVSAAGMMILRQIGSAAFVAAAKGPAPPKSRIPSPEKWIERRARQKGAGWLGFLRSVDRTYDVTFDEKSLDAFKAIHGQDISMASASDTRDYKQKDPRRIEGPVPYECRSGSCGFCWIGVLGGGERLAPISEYEAKRLRYFGYVSDEAQAETHPPIRLACQTQCYGDATIVIPPWNGVLSGRE